MLENLADAQGPGTCGTRDRDHLAVAADRSCVGFDQTVDDLHQRRLAGAVLAQDRMTLTGHDREIGPVVRRNSGVVLSDSLELAPRPCAWLAGGCIRRADRRSPAPMSGRLPGSAATSRSRDCSSSAATATAIAPGSRPSIPAMPIGPITRAIDALSNPR